MRKYIFITIGIIALVLGMIGVIIPMFPSFPFLMLATYSFAKGSRKLEKWFKETNLYKNNLEDYVIHKSLTLKAKLRIMTVVTILMMFGFIMMGIKGIIMGCAILFIIWLFHIIYFCFGIKTKEV